MTVLKSVIFDKGLKWQFCRDLKTLSIPHMLLNIKFTLKRNLILCFIWNIQFFEREYKQTKKLCKNIMETIDKLVI
jgi:hypothetical protein